MQNQGFGGPRREPFVAPTERDVAFQGLPAEHESLLKETLFPDDAYSGQTYWADLPAGQRTKWINKQHSAEASRERKEIREMFKADPLDPIYKYIRNYAITGVGFFTEGYVLFSVRNVLPLLEAVWPSCWKEHKACNKTMVQAISSLEILGIMCGQIVSPSMFQVDSLLRHTPHLQPRVLPFCSILSSKEDTDICALIVGWHHW